MYALASTFLSVALTDDELGAVVGGIGVGEGGQSISLGSGYVGNGINVGQLGTNACYICGYGGNFSTVTNGAGPCVVVAFNNFTTNNGRM